jgi:hypothetical protein
MSLWNRQRYHAQYFQLVHSALFYFHTVSSEMFILATLAKSRRGGVGKVVRVSLYSLHFWIWKSDAPFSFSLSALPFLPSCSFLSFFLYRFRCPHFHFCIQGRRRRLFPIRYLFPALKVLQTKFDVHLATLMRVLQKIIVSGKRFSYFLFELAATFSHVGRKISLSLSLSLSLSFSLSRMKEEILPRGVQNNEDRQRSSKVMAGAF